MHNRIKEIRKCFGLSQINFGEKLGVSRDVINNLENGRVEPKPLILKHISSVFSVSENWLMTGEGEMIEPQTISEEIAAWAGTLAMKSDDDFAKRFAFMLSQLEDSEWKFIEAKLASLFDDHKKGKD